ARIGRTMTEPAPPGNRWLAYAVHGYTASGLVFAMLAALEICAANPDPRRVFLWFLIATLIDATDGTLARRFHTKTLAAAIDGRTIDDIIDFLTFTFLPLMLVAKMGWLPEPALLFVGPALIASVLGFANVKAKDENGGFFLGFPSYWNIVAFYMGLTANAYGGWPNALAMLGLAALTLAPVGFFYPNLAPPRWRQSILIGAAIWLAIVLAMLPQYPHPPGWLLALSLVYPVFYTGVSLYEYNRYSRRHAEGERSTDS
ncbi:MAG: CDP-alcohol phosphatidyltransferase family protein, partial [Candidatus Sericytochromatia bacterium]